MAKGAHSVHQHLRTELEDYIKSQYFGKTPLLLSAIEDKLGEEGVLYQKPYIESSPAYKSIPNGIAKADIPDWMKEFFLLLAQQNLGVYPSPFQHQIKALEIATQEKDLFVSTGTGSGKTECFMWPLLAKLASEAREKPESWNQRGVRTIVMYPMNALVSDQVSRLRKLIGDPEHKFVNAFRTIAEAEVRRPQFGMYTGRTPYPGNTPQRHQDKALSSTLAKITSPKEASDKAFFERLLKDGKIPAKENMPVFLEGLSASKHIPDSEDAELITRFEMQQFCPDILITNYSMLEYMLLRPRENKIWEDTRKWLDEDENNKLLFIIDEAHMYRGSAGGEVAFLIRRLFHKLKISRERVQFILTTASMPDTTEKDRASVQAFARDLTAASTNEFFYLTGEREALPDGNNIQIPIEHFNTFKADQLEVEELQLKQLSAFWRGVQAVSTDFSSIEVAGEWMYEHLSSYEPFRLLFQYCRGNAISLKELAHNIFPEETEEVSLNAVSVLLAIAPLAKNCKGSVLFPARMHMLFRGIKGVYACANEQCVHSHSEEGLTLGEVFLSDARLTCPHCGSVVYELFNDRRCGTLFYKGYVLENAWKQGRAYLWRYAGQIVDSKMKEIHLYLPPSGYVLEKSKRKYPIKPCYLDVASGFVEFNDDTLDGKIGVRKLYYSEYTAKGKPDVITFSTCPHCRHTFSKAQLTAFSTRGNQSFFNLIKAQFNAQPAVPGKNQDPLRMPNEGRKVLLFSDSRQRAAKLARDMSQTSDGMAARQLLALAVKRMEEIDIEQSMNAIYGFFALEAALHNVHLFYGRDREKFAEDCASILKSSERNKRRKKIYIPNLTIDNAPDQMKEQLLQLYCGSYNTLNDSAISWIEPTDQELVEAVDSLEDRGVVVTEEEFKEVFNAWILAICDTSVALGHTMPDTLRYNVRQYYTGYGLDSAWEFKDTFLTIMGWKKGEEQVAIWKSVLKERFLDKGQSENERLYIDLLRVKPRFQMEHPWIRCERCAEISAYPLRGHCPSCGSSGVHQMSQKEFDAMSFWRNPVLDALEDEPIRVIDTEEHTAQLSYKDQRDAMWSRTEQYELRFQDLLKDNETPVDILSSTTTMEVGIDIGSLVAVGLRNIPPMRENYQQRAGRAGRRGSSLSTIVTFCEDGAHDMQYFNNPEPMFRGDPRKPWIDISSEKLLQRHLSLVTLQEYLLTKRSSVDSVATIEFTQDLFDEFLSFLKTIHYAKNDILLPCETEDVSAFKTILIRELAALKKKCEEHPELYLSVDAVGQKDKMLLDALYEEGIIPTYSFPKDVVSTYISNYNGDLQYQVERGLDIAIGECAPGRALVVDKTTYQIGGFYYPGSSKRKGQLLTPARGFINDSNYRKDIISCEKCGWFALADKKLQCCPFCGNAELVQSIPMLRPWGFAPRNGTKIADAQLEEEYSFVQQPLYSTLPESNDMLMLSNCAKIKMASRTNQRIIMMNKGIAEKGFVVCCDCGAAMPGNESEALKNVQRPYRSPIIREKCKHSDITNVALGYDFVTDMLVLEIELDQQRIDTNRNRNPWVTRAAQSLAEALRLTASKELDIEFTELITGYRIRENAKGSFVDIYLYDSLSSGAGYAVGIVSVLPALLKKTFNLLTECDCEVACDKCLKHYRNQYIHGMLDRVAAAQLLKWGMLGKLPEALSIEEQSALLAPLKQILSQSGVRINKQGANLVIANDSNQKELSIYPAMWVKPVRRDVLSISDIYMKHGKPYAVDEILASL